MWTLLLALVASARVPDDVTPVLAPVDAPAQYARFLAEQGRSDQELACDTAWPNRALLCFKVRDGKTIRWVTSKDLGRWKVDLPTLREQVSARAREALEGAAPEARTVDDTDKRYWTYAPGDGWSAAALLHPDVVAGQIGEPEFLAAAPVDGVVLVWQPGDAELDRIMAVGAREMFDQRDGPVTPVLFFWNGTRWSEFAEARAVKPPGR